MAERSITSPPPVVAPLPRIFGRYLLIHRLSRGGMGEIFLARYGLAGFEKLAVIKKVLPHLAADEEFIERFVAEAHVAVKMQHANVAQVFEVGRVGDEYFLALEHIHGRDLRRTLTLLADSGRGVPLDLSLFIAREVANALAYAHRRVGEDGKQLGLVHCDISPPNVMMSFEGEVKIIDFGIAKSALKALDGDSKRGFGKFGYMAPEQLIRGREVDSRTDIYALGTVLFEMLTGTRLYQVGDTPDYRALARMVAKGQHPLPSDIDSKLAPYDELVARALKPKPDDRYATAAEFRDSIQRELVKINPTISTDELAAFMRFMFAEDVLRQQEEIERLDKTQLSQWEHELTRESQQTVSFALGGALDTAALDIVGASVDAPVPAELRGAAQAAGIVSSVEPPESDTDADVDRDVARAIEEADRTEIVGRQPLAEVEAERPSRPIALWAAAAVMVVAIGFGLSWVVNARGGGSTERAASVAAGAGPGTVAEPVADDAVIEPLPAVSAADAGAAAKAVEPTRPDRETGTKPATKADAVKSGAKKKSDKKGDAKKKAKDGKSDEKKDEATKDETRGEKPEAGGGARMRKKFQRASKEYKAFRSKFGRQLESEWTDLLTAVQFGGSHKAEALEKRIDRFRSKMRRIKAERL